MTGVEAPSRNGVALLRLGRRKDALAAFDRAIELDPMSAMCHGARGDALLGLGRLQEALAACDRAIGLDPQLAYAHGSRAKVLCALARYEEAVAAYGRVLDLEPGNALVANDLAWVLATCPQATVRDPARALDLAQKAIAAAPSAGAIQNTLGVAFYRVGKMREALDALGESMRLQAGGDAYDWFFAAMASARLGEREEARSLYDRAVAWTKEHAPEDPELRRFQEEAAEVLKAK